MRLQIPLQLGLGRRLPVILQTEAAECGLACLAMVAGYHGFRTDLATMRRRFSVSLKGATLKSLIDIAKAVELAGRPLRLDMQHLPELKLPCVLHWNMNHFVVLKSVSATKAVIHDPAVGERSLTLEEFSKHFTGVALELNPTAGFVKKDEQQHFSLFSLMGRVIGLGRGMAQILLLGIALEVIAIATPFYNQWIVDQALVAGDRELITVLGLGFILLVIIKTSITAFRSWVVATLSINLNFQWQGNIFAHLLKLPLEYFEKRHLGDIVSRFGSVSTIQRTITTSFVQAMVDGLLVIGTFIMMLIYSFQLAFIAIIAVLIYAALRGAVYHPMRDATAEQIVHAAKQQTHFLETARGIQSVRLFGRGEERRIGWLNMLAEQFNADLRINRISISYEAANTLVFGIEHIVIIWLAALLVIERQFSVGMIFAFIAYKDQFSSRLSSLIDKIFEFRMLRLHGERVADIVLTEAEPEPVNDEVDLNHISPDIHVKNLSFSYSSTEPVVLHNIDLHIRAGEFIAITGASGCGKTTLVKIILGLLNPTEGEVRLGGLPIQQIGLNNYRHLIGTVMQDDTLFSGSIADNISFFDPSIDQARVEASAKLAAIHAEIMAMPMGYNTLVGDIGSGMSGGQKQRVLLARSLYKQPKILVLDEATSHLDILNEKN
ncbi:MAG: peptidase domain-containing ABC transporter, partial [Betaproteobacteria bacterium]|nr:peptidase domain-containing ABC transporter [Betaproteobacteria bacterium]